VHEVGVLTTLFAPFSHPVNAEWEKQPLKERTEGECQGRTIVALLGSRRAHEGGKQIAPSLRLGGVARG
jgi:hypothetical protein